MNPLFYSAIIYIDAREEVVNYCNQGITDIISIGHKGSPPPNIKHFQHVSRNPNKIPANVSPPELHSFEFDDIHEASPFARHAEEADWPSEWDIKRMIDVFNVIKARLEDGGEAKVLFHCAAGISRSTAAAFIYLVVLGWDFQRALWEVRRVRKISSGGIDCVHPNILMVKHADNILGLGSKMLEFMAGELNMESYRWVWGTTFDLELVRKAHKAIRK